VILARCDSDTWDLATSVGATATMVAAARALASMDAGPVINDPFAAELVRAEYLSGRGWQVASRPRRELFADYGRPFPTDEALAAFRNIIAVIATAARRQHGRK
jgi:O-methyltransferase involved in polyketide biosynthesis